MTIAESSSIELRQMLRNREVSSRELVSEALKLADENQHLGAYVSVQPELALQEADELDALIGRTAAEDRASLPALAGLPTAHKDLVNQRGHVTTHGSTVTPPTVATEDEPVAEAVRAAGAISIGKTQVPEFGVAGYSENLLAPPARNPFDLEVTAGGSSGGTAAAVAARLLPAAIGSDGGGSVRIPSGATGLVGLKPGRDVVAVDRKGWYGSRGDGGPRMGVSGPIARNALDAALWYDALMGHSDERSIEAVRRADELQGMRIGVSLESPFDSWIDVNFTDDARAALAAGIATLEARGHHVETTHIDYGTKYPEAFTTYWISALGRMELEPGAEERMGELAQWFRNRALQTTPEQLTQAIGDLNDFIDSVTRQWGAYDFILTPALSSTPPRIGKFWERGPAGDYQLQCEWAPQTSIVNVGGQPAIAVPTSVAASGVPMGVQLIGRAGSEAKLLQMAEQLMHP